MEQDDDVGPARNEAIRIGPAGVVAQWRTIPAAAGVVVYAHAGGGDADAQESERLVAEVLHDRRLCALELVLSFDDAALAEALPGPEVAQPIVDALDWLQEQPQTVPRRSGVLATGSGAALALWAAAARRARVGAVVSQGGWHDRVVPPFDEVQAPTMLIVGGSDTEALANARVAMTRLRCNKRLEVVPGAGRRFREPGSREAAAHLAAAWFATHLDVHAR